MMKVDTNGTDGLFAILGNYGNRVQIRGQIKQLIKLSFSDNFRWDRRQY